MVYVSLDKNAVQIIVLFFVFLFLFRHKNQYFVGTHEKRVRKAFLMSTNLICFPVDIRQIIKTLRLKKNLIYCAYENFQKVDFFLDALQR